MSKTPEILRFWLRSSELGFKSFVFFFFFKHISWKSGWEKTTWKKFLCSCIKLFKVSLRKSLVNVIYFSSVSFRVFSVKSLPDSWHLWCQFYGWLSCVHSSNPSHSLWLQTLISRKSGYHFFFLFPKGTAIQLHTKSSSLQLNLFESGHPSGLLFTEMTTYVITAVTHLKNYVSEKQ